MQFMADFLLEATARPTPNKVKSAASEPARAAPDRRAGFSDIYAQQQKARAVAEPARAAKTSAAERSRDADVPRSENRAIEKKGSAPVKKDSQEHVESKPGAEGKGVVEAKSVEEKRQGQEVDSADGKQLPLDEEMAEVEGLDALLDPLLAQIMQAQQEDAMPATGMDAAEPDAGLLAVAGAAQGWPVTTLGVHAATGKQGQAQAAESPLTTTAGAAEEGVVLDEALTQPLELDSEGLLEEPTGRGLLQSGLLATRAEMAQENRLAPAQVLADAKTDTQGQPQVDTLLRTESVQQSAAARQVLGQPLAMQQPGWSKELTEKVMWISSQNLKSAEITLNPAELGRLEIRVQMNQEQAQVSFISQHAGVRDSLEAQAFRLREMLAQQGMQDVDVNVADQPSQEQQDERELRELLGQDAGMNASVDDEVDESLVTEVPQLDNGANGRLSYYV